MHGFKDPDTNEIERILASTQSQGTHADACREIQACDGNHYEPNLYQNNFGLEVKGLTESSKSRLAGGRLATFISVDNVKAVVTVGELARDKKERENGHAEILTRNTRKHV